MSTHQTKGWQKLQTKATRSGAVPKLYYKFVVTQSTSDFVADKVELLLTDVVVLWRYVSTTAFLLEEATRQHTSIDPSESAQQLHVFLSKLEQGLESGRSQLSSLASEEDGTSSNLRLSITTRLPSPFKPLKFAFKLRREAQEAFATAIVGPAIQQLNLCKQQLASLLEVVKEKDHVMSKVLDNVSSLNWDMSTIFPTLTGAGGRKGNVTVDMAKQRIRGMSEFDQNEWMNRFVKELDGDRGLADMERSITDLEDNKQAQQWHETLGVDAEGSSNDDQSPDNEEYGRGSGSQPGQATKDGEDEDTASEDEFERAATPPSARRNAVQISGEAQNLEGGREFQQQRTSASSQKDKHLKTNLGSSSSSSRDSSPSHRRFKANGIRGLAKRKAISESASVVSSPTRSATKSRTEPPTKEKSAGSDTTATDSSTSGSDSRRLAKSNRSKGKLGGLRSRSRTSTSPARVAVQNLASSSHPKPSDTSTPSRRLGRIGKSRLRTGTTSPIPEEKHSLSPMTPSHRLGRIGIKKQYQVRPFTSEAAKTDANSSEDHVVDDDLDAGVSPVPARDLKRKKQSPGQNRREKVQQSELPPQSTPSAPPPPEVHETEEQKVLRKKEELRKTIASGPVKKKRRF